MKKVLLIQIDLMASPPRFYSFAGQISKNSIWVSYTIQKDNLSNWSFRKKIWEYATCMASSQIEQF